MIKAILYESLIGSDCYWFLKRLNCLIVFLLSWSFLRAHELEKSDTGPFPACKVFLYNGLR